MVYVPKSVIILGKEFTYHSYSYEKRTYILPTFSIQNYSFSIIVTFLWLKKVLQICYIKKHHESAISLEENEKI
jgi:hypothetical protein